MPKTEKEKLEDKIQKLKGEKQQILNWLIENDYNHPERAVKHQAYREKAEHLTRLDFQLEQL